MKGIIRLNGLVHFFQCFHFVGGLVQEAAKAGELIPQDGPILFVIIDDENLFAGHNRVGVDDPLRLNPLFFQTDREPLRSSFPCLAFNFNLASHHFHELL